ncbi:MAG: orotate phosphoribosyltransferase [Legionella sp. 40-6]|nr:orotate phosphoribosyltransferase [Legionella sp.]OJY46415.1 MAG: orotate phosphoribosyltransferase [Legionella sp. 40-6]
MNDIKTSFIKLALDCGVLKFGHFTLKSGRISPYFFNAGLFYQGKALSQLGQFYAQTLINHQVEFDQLFGPAYKGLPLATATAIALAHENLEVTVTFNRKEIKDHGEGGQLIGASLTGRTIIIDDVITAGTAFRESRDLIKSNGGILTGVLIALDRCERGEGKTSAVMDIINEGIAVYSIINFFDLLEYLEQHGHPAEIKKMRTYHTLYGV